MLYDWYDQEKLSIYVENCSDDVILVSGLVSRIDYLPPLEYFYLKTDYTREFQSKEYGTYNYWHIIRCNDERTAIIKLVIVRKSIIDSMTKEDAIENEVYDASYVLTFEELESMGFKFVYEGVPEDDAS